MEALPFSNVFVCAWVSSYLDRGFETGDWNYEQMRLWTYGPCSRLADYEVATLWADK